MFLDYFFLSGDNFQVKFFLVQKTCRIRGYPKTCRDDRPSPPPDIICEYDVINFGHNYNQCALISINMIVLIRVKFKYSLSGTDFISVERNCNEYFHVRL